AGIRRWPLTGGPINVIESCKNGMAWHNMACKNSNVRLCSAAILWMKRPFAVIPIFWDSREYQDDR
ncbi:MAG: hypothetical protein WCJ76_15320, partial [Comamonadaceae bacterium]